MRRQKTNQDRDLLNNRGLYQAVAIGAMWILRCANLAHGHNSIFGIDDLNWGMLRGALLDASVGGCAKAQKHRDGGTPSDRWFASRLKGIPLRLIQAAFEERLARQYDIFRKLKRIPKEGLTLAVDMHLISRYDRKPGEELTRSRYRRGRNTLSGT